MSYAGFGIRRDFRSFLGHAAVVALVGVALAGWIRTSPPALGAAGSKAKPGTWVLDTFTGALRLDTTTGQVWAAGISTSAPKIEWVAMTGVPVSREKPGTWLVTYTSASGPDYIGGTYYLFNTRTGKTWFRDGYHLYSADDWFPVPEQQGD